MQTAPHSAGDCVTFITESHSMTLHRRSLTLRAGSSWKYAHEVNLPPRFGFWVGRFGHHNAKARCLTLRRKTVFNMYDGHQFFDTQVLGGSSGYCSLGSFLVPTNRSEDTGGVSGNDSR